MKPGDLAELRVALEEVDCSGLPSRPTGPTVFDGITRVIVHDVHTAVDDDGTRRPTGPSPRSIRRCRRYLEATRGCR